MQLPASTKVAVIGLGYVGLPLAVALARHFDTTGIDINAERIAALRSGHDATHEIDAPTLQASALKYASDMASCAEAEFIIVTVPTPVDSANEPDLGPVEGATRALAAALGGSKPIIVYESTVYPGVTEDFCGPIIEAVSGRKRSRDFFLAYSPERINPGDREHTVDKIIKVVSGESEAVLDRVSALYGAVTTGGVFRAASIKAAEAAKVIENAQRDINIAFINEITLIFQRMNLSVYDVLDAAQTKWNFLPFQPGLVGGHCIGVDPYYLSYKARQLGHLPRVILAGRTINDSMGQYVADEVHDRLRRPARVLVLGLTFKEDVPDLRNSKVVDIIKRLQWLGHNVTVHDPLADPAEALHEYGFGLDADALSRSYDAVVLAVRHKAYLDLGKAAIEALIEPDGLLADLKGTLRRETLRADIGRWQL